METGQRLASRYELQSLLGRGGMGEVWRAHDLTLDRTVAVKALIRDLSGEDLREALARFRREALAAARLNHPSIATIYVGVCGPLPSDIVLRWTTAQQMLGIA